MSSGVDADVAAARAEVERLLNLVDSIKIAAKQAQLAQKVQQLRAQAAALNLLTSTSTTTTSATAPGESVTLSVGTRVTRGSSFQFTISGFEPNKQATYGIEGGGSGQVGVDQVGGGTFTTVLNDAPGTYTFYVTQVNPSGQREKYASLQVQIAEPAPFAPAGAAAAAPLPPQVTATPASTTEAPTLQQQAQASGQTVISSASVTALGASAAGQFSSSQKDQDIAASTLQLYTVGPGIQTPQVVGRIVQANPDGSAVVAPFVYGIVGYAADGTPVWSRSELAQVTAYPLAVAQQAVQANRAR